MDRPRLGEQRVDFTPPDRVGDRRLGILPLLLSDPPIGGGLILTASCPMGLEQTDGRGRGGLIDQSGIMLREGGARSEEHTSELQSLMRISYAVFCLKKKQMTHDNTI